jgi:glutamate 5-kinase
MTNAQRPRLVLKVGTNVLQRPNAQLDYNLIHELSATIAQLRQRGYDVLFVSSGSIGAGRERCRHLSVDSPQSSAQGRKALGLQQMLAAIGQVRLMQIYSEFFQEHQILVAQMLLTRNDFAHRAAYLNIRNTVEQTLRAGVLPIINENDVVSTAELAPTFGDNDQLAVYVAALAGAERLFFLTSAPGVLKAEMSAEGLPHDVIIPEVWQVDSELLRLCQRPSTSAGRGGMESKVLAAGKAMSFGIHAHIAAGKQPDVVPRILAGERIGTHFVANEKPVRGYRQWLAAGALSQGDLIVDAGAEDALRYRKKSLLLSGVCEVRGDFEGQVPVNIRNLQGELLGVGTVASSAQTLRHLLQSQDVSRQNKAIVNRDDLFLTGGHSV